MSICIAHYAKTPLIKTVSSLQPSGPVLRRCDRSVVCAVHWLRMLCWLCSAHWSSPSLTSVVQRWLVCLEHCCRDYSLCWTPPLD